MSGATAPAVGPSRDPIEIGDEAFFIGHPDARLSFQHPEPVLATALVSAKEAADKGGRRLRLQASLSHGFSGGGLFSRRTGLLMGIVDARMGPALSPEEEAYVNGVVDEVGLERPVLRHLLEESDRGVAYAIGLDDVRPFVGDALTHLGGARPAP